MEDEQLQQAKDNIAKQYNCKDWFAFMVVHRKGFTEISEAMLNEVAIEYGKILILYNQEVQKQNSDKSFYCQISIDIEYKCEIQCNHCNGN
jgi:hypothetical protein